LRGQTALRPERFSMLSETASKEPERRKRFSYFFFGLAASIAFF
jgi:hypothetical protein